MATDYNGQGTLVSATGGAAGSRVAIAGILSQTPIGVQTSSAHGYHTGDTVEIENATVAAANGQFQIVVVNSTEFTLNGTTASGSGGAGGYAMNWELLPAYTIPANGDLADMGVLGATLEGLANPFPFLFRRVGTYRLFQIYNNGSSPASPVTSWSHTGSLTSTWTTLTSASSLLTFSYPFPLQSTDILVAWVTFTQLPSGAAGDVAVRLTYEVNGGSATPLIGSQASFYNGTQNVLFPTTMLGFVQPGAYSSFNFGLQGWGNQTGISLDLVGDWQIVVAHLRQN